jgi:centrin-1
MADIKQEILSEINQCRTNPAGYSSKLQGLLKHYNGKILQKPGSFPVETEEGKENVQNCIAYLKSLKPLSKLSYNLMLEKAATDHVNDIGPVGGMGGTSTNGLVANERIEKYGDWAGALGENISYGNSNAKDIIIEMIIDDGVSSRPSRLNILNPNYKYIGVGFGAHKEFENIVVVDFVESITEKNPEMKKSIRPADNLPKPSIRPSVFKKKQEIKFSPSHYVGHGFTEDDIIELKEAFDLFDLDKSGFIDPNELKTVMEEFGLDARYSTVAELMSEIDTDMSEKIDFQEFLEMIRGKPEDENSMSQIRKVFNVFDTGKTGTINLKDLIQVSEELGESLSDRTLVNLIKKGDSNNDGRVSFQDFYYIMTKTFL